jgi:hypothetical protein
MVTITTNELSVLYNMNVSEKVHSWASVPDTHIRHEWLSFLGVFTKLRKATISFVVSVRPSGTIWLPVEGILWNDILLFFRNFVDII